MLRRYVQPEGVVKIHALGKITEDEKELIKAAVPELKTNIDKVNCTLNSTTNVVFTVLSPGR